jgi:hypothetical protein
MVQFKSSNDGWLKSFGDIVIESISKDGSASISQTYLGVREGHDDVSTTRYAHVSIYRGEDEDSLRMRLNNGDNGQLIINENGGLSELTV